MIRSISSWKKDKGILESKMVFLSLFPSGHTSLLKVMFLHFTHSGVNIQLKIIQNIQVCILFYEKTTHFNHKWQEPRVQEASRKVVFHDQYPL